MLEPDSRHLLLEALQPPEDHCLDWAVGTTYTLDLLALLMAPVAFAFSDWQQSDGKPTSNPMALLKAVRQFADQICLFCQAGKIHVPKAYQPLLAGLEDSVVEAAAPLGGSFHPKVWFLRFIGPDEDILYRVLCLSRNLTFDRSWDTLLRLEGPLRDRANAYANNHPLGDFVEALPTMSVRPLATLWQKRFEQLSYELRRVEFETPKPFEDYRFFPIGLKETNHWPFPPKVQQLLLISPFVDDAMVSELAGWNAPMQLISRPESLACLKSESLNRFEKLWTLDDAADPEPGETETEQPSEVEVYEESAIKADSDIPLIGLHAKVYVADFGWDSCVVTGSANATFAAFNRNVEFLVQLIGKKKVCGVDATLGHSDQVNKKRASSLADLLQPYSPCATEAVIDEEVESFERRVDEIARDFAAVALILDCQPTDSNGFTLRLKPTKPVKRNIAQNCHVMARPISFAVSQQHEVNLEQETWLQLSSVSLLGLTSFTVFEITAPDHPWTRSFVLKTPLVNAPENRHEAILRDLLSDSQRVIRFLLLMLMDSGARELGGLKPPNGDPHESPSVVNSLFETTLFESLVRALDCDPERLDQVAQIIEDLERTDEGKGLLPAGLKSIWDPIWLVRQKQLERQTRKATRGGGK